MTTRKTTRLGLRRFRGSAVLDAALVLPVLLSLTFGMIEYGYFFFVKHSMQGAAREGCRNAILSSATPSTVKTAVIASLYASGLNSNQATLDTKYTFTMRTGATTITDPAAVPQGGSIAVQLDASWGTIGVRPLGLIGAAKVCTGVTVMRKEAEKSRQLCSIQDPCETRGFFVAPIFSRSGYSNLDFLLAGSLASRAISVNRNGKKPGSRASRLTRAGHNRTDMHCISGRVKTCCTDNVSREFKAFFHAPFTPIQQAA